MKILAVADEESRYLWDHFSPDKLRGVDLILSCRAMCRRSTFPFWPPLAGHLCCMCTATMMRCTSIHRRKAASVWKIPFMNTAVCACWGWAVPSAISTGPFSVHPAADGAAPQASVAGSAAARRVRHPADARACAGREMMGRTVRTKASAPSQGCWMSTGPVILCMGMCI